MKYFFLLLGFFSFLETYAVTVVTTPPDGVIVGSPIGFISNLITYAIGLAAILGVIGITWGGIQIILSVGEDEKRKKAKNTIVYSIIGVVVAGLAFSLVNLIGNFRI